MEKNKKLTEIYNMNAGNEQDNDTMWMMTFTDILALMLVFFIMNYSMSTVKKGEWEKVTDSMSNSFKSSSIVESINEGAPLGVDNQFAEMAVDIGYLFTVLNNKIRESIFLKNNININKSEDRIEITFNSSMMFEYSDNKFSYDGEVALFAVGNIIHQVSNKIEIKVYADDMPIINPNKFTSNLQLAFMRGILIGEEIQKFGNSSKIDVFVHSFERFDKRADKKSGRFGKVSIVIREYAGEQLQFINSRSRKTL